MHDGVAFADESRHPIYVRGSQTRIVEQGDYCYRSGCDGPGGPGSEADGRLPRLSAPGDGRPLSTVGLKGKYNLRDVWAHKEVARKATKWSGSIKPHETKVFVLGNVK